MLYSNKHSCCSCSCYWFCCRSCAVSPRTIQGRRYRHPTNAATHWIATSHQCPLQQRESLSGHLVLPQKAVLSGGGACVGRWPDFIPSATDGWHGLWQCFTAALDAAAAIAGEAITFGNSLPELISTRHAIRDSHGSLGSGAAAMRSTEVMGGPDHGCGTEAESGVAALPSMADWEIQQIC